MHLRAVVIPTWVYAILWRSSFVYTSALIRKSYNSLRTAHTTINHTPHGSIKSGRPPRRSIVALSHSAHSYLLLLGVTIFIFRLATIFARFFQSPLEFTTEPKQASLRSYALPINRSVAMRPPTARRLARAVVGCIASLSDIPSGIDWYIRAKPLWSSCSECSTLPPTAIHRT